ncbi:MAG: hypothetical protein ACK46X_04580 [Candidatus Sericytochromatia bacterium]
MGFNQAWVGVTLASAVLLAACAGTPGRVPKPTIASKPGATASAKPKPKPIPSLGLLLAGRVTVEPGAIVASKAGQVTERGVSIIGNHGGGILSDNGLGIIANSGAGYRVAQAGQGLKPVEGMWVKAVSLLDGKVLAGPVATDADGRYQLGFLKAPERNMRVVAAVPGQEANAAVTYTTLVPPKQAEVVTTDTTRLAAAYILDVLPQRLQPAVDVFKREAVYQKRPGDPSEAELFADQFGKVPHDKLAAADVDGSIARGVSERIVAYVDLTNPIFESLNVDIEELRAFSNGLAVQPTPSLPDQFLAMVRRPGHSLRRELPPLLLSLGMPEAQALDLTGRLSDKGDQVGVLLQLAFVSNQQAVLAPIAALAN